MRRWLTGARVAAVLVSERPDLWVPGALVWSLTIGWIPFVVAVARPPTVADLTFLGARIYSSGAWPWNAITVAGGLAVLAGVAFLLLVLAEAWLIVRGAGRPAPPPGTVVRLAAVSLVTAVPAIAAIVAFGVAFVLRSIDEFVAPGVGDPLIRTLGRLTGFLTAVALTWILGGIIHAAASRSAVLDRAGVSRSLATAPRRLAAGPLAIALQALAAAVLRLVYLVVATVLLVVLWAPIGDRLAVGGMDAALLLLLVGFVAIWLCLLLGGGALQAWGSVSWTAVLVREPGGGRDQPRTHGEPHRP